MMHQNDSRAGEKMCAQYWETGEGIFDDIVVYHYLLKHEGPDYSFPVDMSIMKQCVEVR